MNEANFTSAGWSIHDKGDKNRRIESPNLNALWI